MDHKLTILVLAILVIWMIISSKGFNSWRDVIAYIALWLLLTWLLTSYQYQQ